MRHSGRMVILVMLAAACAGRGEPKSLTEHRAGWAEELRALDERLEQLEERLLVDQARVRFWLEMRERHQSASAVACTTLGHHAEAIAAYGEQQRQKIAARAKSAKKKNRVATNYVPEAEVVR